MRQKKLRNITALAVAAFILLNIFCITGCSGDEGRRQVEMFTGSSVQPDISPAVEPAVEEYLGELVFHADTPWIELNKNIPEFGPDDITTEPFETYAELDELGRCGVAYANICQELMPTEPRQSISEVKPSGWVNKDYGGLVDGGYLYNRCHLIGFQLAGENANERNLITGTRYLNIQGMLPFENMVADYVQETNNHVLYRVTPIYDSNDLVASGVQMEGYSVEDEGKAICFNIFAYNAQPGVAIDYATGDSWLDETVGVDGAGEPAAESVGKDYVLNTNSKKFHSPDCANAADISERNRQEFNGARDELIAQGYSPCKACNP